MKIAVCIKQVPLASELAFDFDRKLLRREGIPLTLNAYDRRSLAEAVRLRGLLGGEIVVVTMGPPRARAALLECLALGCDRAIHVCDPALAGSDALVTARVLAAALRPEAADVVFCGRRSVDGETGQVGPSLAELLGYAQVIGATKVTPTDDPGRLIVEREADDCIEVLEVRLPAVLTAAERLARAAAAAPSDPAEDEGRVRTVTAAELGFRRREIGRAGSPTRVKSMQRVKAWRRPRLITGEPEVAAERLAALLVRSRMPPPRWPSTPASGVTERRRSREPQGPEFWVVADRQPDSFQTTVPRLLGEAVELVDRFDGRVAVVLIGREPTGDQLTTLASYGADRVYSAADERLAEYQVEPYAELLCRLIRRHEPEVVMFSAADMGRDLAPRVAARLGLGLIAECDGGSARDGRCVWQKRAPGGLASVSSAVCSTRPELVTIRRSALPMPEPLEHPERPELVEVEVAGLPASAVSLVGRHSQVGPVGPTLEHAQAVVCVGSGLGGPEHLPLVEQLAQALGGAVGATRKVVDHGWLPRQQQIGLSGKSVTPRLYVGIGVSGGFNHTVGIVRSKVIVAINKDPEARIFGVADFGIVGEWQAVVPTLTRAVSERVAAFRAFGAEAMARDTDGSQ